MEPHEFPNFRWIGSSGNRRVGSPLWHCANVPFCGAGICIPDCRASGSLSIGWAWKDGFAQSLECASVHGLGETQGIAMDLAGVSLGTQEGTAAPLFQFCRIHGCGFSRNGVCRSRGTLTALLRLLLFL